MSNLTFFFFFSQHSPPQAVTRLSEDNCKIHLVVYIENTCFPFGMHLNYMEKIKEKKKQEGQITIIHILKFVCSERDAAEEVLLYHYLALC